MRARIMFNTAATVLLAAVLVACGPDDKADESSSSNSSTPKASPSATPTLEVPATDGTWQQAGDLCKILTPEIVRNTLNYDDTIDQWSDFNPEWLPAIQGIDACHYWDPNSDKGFAVSVSVRKANESAWAATERYAAKHHPRSYHLISGGEVIVTTDQQALVYKNGVMASALNSSLGKFDPVGLARLTALAASIVESEQ